MQTESVSLEVLRHPEKNARVHPEAQIVELAKAVKMFGQTRPVVVDEGNTIIVGNGLVDACRRIGLTDVSVLRLSGLTDDAKTKLMLSDNKVFQLGLDDHNVIMELIRELDDLNIPGFDEEILRSLTTSTPDATREALAGYGTLSDEAISDALTRSMPPGSTEPPEALSVLNHEIICPKCGHIFDR
jgi:hypothetical protein